jgi:hypothetical protein
VATGRTIGATADWTNKVELADLEGDGDVDLLFANGGNYESPGEPVASRVFLNNGDGRFVDGTRDVFGRTVALARVIKVADLNADGRQDIVLGTTYSTQSRLIIGAENGGWRDVTASQLPAAKLSVGDLEIGDVDGDRDLDLVLADWGRGSPMTNTGGRVVLWRNDGTGHFVDATDRMPATLVRFSWDLELVDVDNDWDLDVAVSCKTCVSSLLYVNTGTGRFVDRSEQQMPAYTNNYEFAPIDLDGDGYLDLVTINDGVERPAGMAEHVFRNDRTGRFVDVTDRWWPEEDNPGWDDNVVVGVDAESDGDADFMVGSLDGPDRLLVNDGTGRLTLVENVLTGTPSTGTLGLAVADLDGDGRIDVVESQGEVPDSEDERVYLATDAVPTDAADPVVVAQSARRVVVARVHDNLTPYAPYAWRAITARWRGGSTPMQWYGENLFRAEVPASARDVAVCAVDLAGNRRCAVPR